MKAKLLVALSVLFAIGCQQKEKDTTVDTPTTTTEITENVPKGKECFLKVIEGQAEGGITIRDSVSFTIEYTDTDSISGTYLWRPYEKDKKTSQYKGILHKNMGKVIATSNQEGKEFTEDLIFILKDDKLSLLFGEMTQGKDNIWHYKDTTATSSQILDKVSCK